MSIEVEVVMAWPRRHASVLVQLPAGAVVADAVALAALTGAGDATGTAIFGRVVMAGAALAHGDRVELLRPLQVDPKEARRRRAARKPG